MESVGLVMYADLIVAGSGGHEHLSVPDPDHIPVAAPADRNGSADGQRITAVDFSVHPDHGFRTPAPAQQGRCSQSDSEKEKDQEEDDIRFPDASPEELPGGGF